MRERTSSLPKHRTPSGRQLRAQGRTARFVGYHAEPEHSYGLAADHPAVVDGRTLFPGNVVSTANNPRFLVSGKNNPKTGGMVLKGEWAGMPIYTLTLHERDTCPRSCAMWRECMGNSMQWPRRADARDPDFMPALAAEVITVARQHPKGFVVRLHVLGDFYSVRYVLLWANLLAIVPNLRVFGYSARRSDDPDPESARIGLAVETVRQLWSRFAVRTSHAEAGPMRSIVVDEDPKAPGVFVCPAQTEATAACSTCGLCWAPAAKDRTVAFLRHGMKRTRGGRDARHDLPA